MPNKPDYIQDKALAAFQKWVDANDPQGLLDMQEQIAAYAKAMQEQAVHDHADHQENGDCAVRMGLFATEKGADDLNKLLKHSMGLKEKVKVGQGVQLMYRMNMGLHGLVPSNHEGMKAMLRFLKNHPDSLHMPEEDKAKLMTSLDEWAEEAQEWYALVATVKNSFAKIFMLNEIAIEKAVNELNKNEVVIE